MLPLNQGGDKCQVLVCGPVPLSTNREHIFFIIELIPKKLTLLIQDYPCGYT